MAAFLLDQSIPTYDTINQRSRIKHSGHLLHKRSVKSSHCRLDVVFVNETLVDSIHERRGVCCATVDIGAGLHADSRGVGSGRSILVGVEDIVDRVTVGGDPAVKPELLTNDAL